MQKIIHYSLILVGIVFLFSCKKKEDEKKLPPGVEIINDSYVINGDATWPDVYTDDRPDYEFDNYLTIEGRLTIAPGVKVLFKKSSAVNPNTKMIINGIIIANGTSSQPIEFSGDGNVDGFQGVNINSKVDLENQFTYCIFDQKLSTSSGAPYIMGMLNMEPSRSNWVNVKVENCIFKNCTYALRVLAGVKLTSFENNTITQNLSPNYCSIFNINVLDKVNNSNSFTNNTIQRIGIGTWNDGLGHDSNMDLDAKIHNVGCDYVITGELGGSNGGKVNFREGGLTIEPGITFYFGAYSFIFGQYKYIKAIGTPSQRIVFKGLTNENNYWNGVYIDCYDQFKSPEQSRFEYCDFYNGGLNSTAWGSFGLGFKSQFYYLYSQFNSSYPAFFVQNCSFNQCNLQLYATDAAYINQDYTTSNQFN